MAVNIEFAPLDAPEFDPFDPRRGWLVVWRNAVESWFDDSGGAIHRAEILSTTNESEVCVVLVWNYAYERWNVTCAYKAGNRLRTDYSQLEASDE